MVILKMALLFLVLTMVWFVALRQNRGPVYGGPFFYADPENNSNPVRPQYRLSFTRAWASNRCVEVYCNEDGLPLLARHLVAHQVTWQMVWIWAQNGRLMRRYTEDPQGDLLKIEVMQATPTPTPVLTSTR